MKFNSDENPDKTATDRSTNNNNNYILFLIILISNNSNDLHERSRKTTATIEVKNKIIKLKQCNLNLDKYIYERINALKANQLLVTDKIINNRLNEIKDDDPIEQWKETKVSLARGSNNGNRFVEAFQKCKNSFKGITQQIAADKICELVKSQIGFGQSAVYKIVKSSELPANALIRDAIKLWID
ncbi:hypothetical protein C1646_761748 [Rhizophagus diaphanus]|nr:hypothetical protein C1646_761748 [Rhizophagus diaphanus] [Rhizophagus sp. MUCL 43196]